MCCGDANYCSVKKITLSEQYIKRANKCKDFEFNPIDALFENKKGYQERKKQKANEDQLKLEVNKNET